MPSPAYSLLHQTMVDRAREAGHIRSPAVEAAFRAIPRHLFVPHVSLDEAYQDQPVIVKREGDQVVSTSSQPSMMAIMLEQLALEPGHRVLEIGAGTGYNAALMDHIVGPAGQVIALDIDQDIVAGARSNLAVAGHSRVQVICADGGYGYPDAAPYDRIVLTVGAQDILPAWYRQLAPGGRLLLPLKVRGLQMSIAFDEVDGHLESRSLRLGGFVLLRGAFAVPASRPVPLSPEPGLTLRLAEAQSVDPEKVYLWLSHINRDRETGVQVTLQEVMGGLDLWLALHEPAWCGLVARNDLASQGVVPLLFRWEGTEQPAFTSILVGEGGLAALVRPPGQGVPAISMMDPFASDAPFLLYVRQFGPDGTAAQQLVRQVQQWHQAGRPIVDDMHIRAFLWRKGVSLPTGSLLVKKLWSHLVIDWL